MHVIKMYEVTVEGHWGSTVYTVGKQEKDLLMRVFKHVTKVAEIELPDQQEACIMMGDE